MFLNEILFFSVNEAPPCSPKDLINTTPYFSETILNPDGNVNPAAVCLPNCLVKEYFTKITEGLIDPRAILRYSNDTGESKLGDPE